MSHTFFESALNMVAEADDQFHWGEVMISPMTFATQQDATRLARAPRHGSDLRTCVASDPGQAEGTMVLILIDTNTGHQRTIRVPVPEGAELAAAAAVLTHPRFAAA